MRDLVLATLFVLLGASSVRGSTLRVPSDYSRIASAVDAASEGDTVLVAPGTYSGGGFRDLEIFDKELVFLSEAGADATIIDCGGTDEEPHRFATFVLTSGQSCTIEGFSFINGVALDDDISGRPSGGAIYFVGGSPHVRDCKFIDNKSAGFGGAVCCRRTEMPTFGRCLFKSGWAGRGGGVHLAQPSFTVFSDCLFEENYSNGKGGGLCADSSASLSLENCRVVHNQSYARGTGMWIVNVDSLHLTGCTIDSNEVVYEGSGAGMCVESANAVMENTIVLGNYGKDGCGGIRMYDGEITMVNCLIADNSADGTPIGGGLYLGNGYGTIRNCTFSGNYGGDGGHIAMISDAHPPLIIENCNFVFSRASGAINAWSYFTGESAIRNCNVYCNKYEDWPSEYDSLFLAGGNVSEPPLFCDRFAGDYHVAAESICMPSNNEAGVLIGAYGEGCDLVPKTWFVDPYGTGDAPTIQAAIDAATHGDSIVLADGTYRGEGNRDITFRGKMLTLTSVNGPDSTVIDCEGSEAVMRGGIYFEDCEGSQSVVSGITISGGYTVNGAGVFCDMYTSPQFFNCRIVDNEASDGGGGAALQESDARFYNCVFSGNRAYLGGAAYVVYRSRGAFENCTIIDNYARGAGGIYISRGIPVITNCIIAYQTRGVGLFNDLFYSPIISCCDIYGNKSGDWVGEIDSLLGVHGNISVDPLFCDRQGGVYTLHPASPCGPDSNACGVLLGALPVYCDTSSEEPDPGDLVPQTYHLYQNHPNPFNSGTTIDFDMPIDSHVEIVIYNTLGQRAATLANGDYPGGEHHVAWLGTNDMGNQLASGVYFYRIKADSFVQSRKMLLLK